MSYEFFILNRDFLIDQLRIKKISHATLAKHLGISTKTVQRWVNNTSNKIRSDSADKLALLFQVERTQLTQTSDIIKIKPRLEALDVILTRSYRQKLMLSGNWLEHYTVLKSFDRNTIPTSQELEYDYALGVTELFIAKFGAASHTLDRAYDLAQKQNNPALLIETLYWRTINDQMRGHFEVVESQANQMEKYLPPHILTSAILPLTLSRQTSSAHR